MSANLFFSKWTKEREVNQVPLKNFQGSVPQSFQTQFLKTKNLESGTWNLRFLFNQKKGFMFFGCRNHNHKFSFRGTLATSQVSYLIPHLGFFISEKLQFTRVHLDLSEKKREKTPRKTRQMKFYAKFLKCLLPRRSKLVVTGHVT